ncbi:MAG: DUF2846 domain-containing protein [Gammaproteobacteria bacterium]|nr:DUF2846 domain-containing protein [Gammaproteobacteria bacterium]
MQDRKLLQWSVTALCLAFLLTGCSLFVRESADSADFIPAEEEKPDSVKAQSQPVHQATVYFYRPDNSTFGWTWKDITIMEIHADGIVTDPDDTNQVTQIGILKNHSYIKKQFAPGLHRFTANWELPPYLFTLEANQTTCIKAEIGFINAVRQRATFKKVDQSVCQREMENAREAIK